MTLRLLAATSLILTGTVWVATEAQGQSTGRVSADLRAPSTLAAKTDDRRGESRYAAIIREALANGPSIEEPGGVWWTGEPVDGPRRKVIGRKLPTESLVLPIDERTGENLATGRIVVKFRDELGMRAPRTPAPFPVSMNAADTGAIEAILAINGATITQWINRTPERLREIAQRAERYSGRPQVDFASIFFVDPPANRLVDAARALNDLDLTDWVVIERRLVTHQQPPDSPQGCDSQNLVICNAPNTFGPTMFTPDCLPPFLVPGTGQTAPCNPDPGDQDQEAEYGCADAACCNLVASILPECTDPDSPRGWDLYCAALANIYCFGTIYDTNNPTLELEDRYDPCLRDAQNGGPNPIFIPMIPLLQASCFEAHTFAGCNNPDCCNAVCQIDPTCCSQEWDSACVSLALQTTDVCGGIGVESPTPDFTAVVVQAQEQTLFGNTITAPRARGQQVYTVIEPVLGSIGVPTPGEPGTQFLASGWRGGGLDLDGMRELAILYANEYQSGGQPLLNGRTINVGVVEFGAFVNHEDFLYASPTNSDGTGGILLEQPKVIAEPGQTIILLPQADTEPDHGTACLGMTVAADNGFGVTGIAHEAQGWFFPIVSVEEGGRIQNAIFSAIETFGPGDVLNFSIGPAGGPFCGDGTHPTLVSDPSIWTLIRLATDSGITSFISAGNSSAEVEAEGGEIRSGALIVGASWPGQQLFQVTPGFNYCRLNFSNWHSGEDPLAVVDLHAWGTAVATTGYGGLFVGETAPGTPTLERNRLRTYTATYGGTSAAAPMMAGAGAVLQGWAKQIYGMPLPPEELGRLMRGSGFQQCGIPYGSPAFPGNDDCPAVGDNLVGDGAQVRHRIGASASGRGVFPEIVAVAASALTSVNWPSIVGNYRVITGREQSPRSPFRLRAQDGIAVELAAVRARAGSVVAGLTYLSSGWTTDIEVTATYNGDPESLVGLAVTNTAAASRSSVVRGVFIFNWQTERWTLLGVDFVPEGVFAPAQFALNVFTPPEPFVKPNSGQVRVRIWTCGLGNTPSHFVFHDFVDVGPAPFLPLP